MPDAMPRLHALAGDTGYATKADLDSLRREVRELQAIVAQLQPKRRSLSAVDRDWLSGLLPAIDVVVADNVWSLVDVAALSLLPANGALASALATRTGLQRLGKALSRCVGHTVGGFELRRVGTCRDGVLWQVVRY